MVHFLNTQPVLCEETFLKYLPQKKAGNHYPAHISHFCSIFSSGAGPAMRVPQCHWKQAHPAALTWRRRKVNKFPFLSRSPTPRCTTKGSSKCTFWGLSSANSSMAQPQRAASSLCADGNCWEKVRKRQNYQFLRTANPNLLILSFPNREL